MTTLFVLAHYDDEYCAWPLIDEARQTAEPIRLAYLATPRNEELRRRRRAETVSFLRSLSFGEDVLIDEDDPPGHDKEMLAAAPAWLERLSSRLAGSDIDRIVVPAWEGGHTDHDLTAAVGVALAGRLSVGEVVQVPLYNGDGLSGPLFHGGRILKGGGLHQEYRLGDRLLAFAAGVRFYPSQAGVWSTMWPAMFWTYLTRGYFTQQLTAARLAERPHAGPLLYERRGYARFEAVAGLAASLLGSHRPARAGAGGRRP